MAKAAKPAAKRVKVEKGADSEPAPTEAPAAAPVKEEKKPARPKTAAEPPRSRMSDVYACSQKHEMSFALKAAARSESARARRR